LILLSFGYADGMSSPDAARIRTTALIVASALFMEQLDATVLATALPTMADHFGVSAMHMSVALTSYMLSLAVFIPASGKIADRFGTRPVFCAAIAIFTLGSALCGQAHSLGFLVGSRLLQGLGGAMMVPVGRLLLLRTIPKEELVAAMSWFLVPALLGPVVGPPLGGLIVTHLSWQWIFYINLPIGVIGMGLVLRYIEDVTERRVQPFDWQGLAISGISLSCLIFGLEIGSRGAIPLPGTVAILVVGFGAGSLYLWHARRHPAPIINIGLMRYPTFKLSVVAGAFTRISGGAVPFLLPLMMQLGFGLSAQQSGLITFTSAAGSMLMKATATRVLRRFGYRRTMIWNGLLGCGFLAMIAAFRPDWPMPLIYFCLLLGGFFQSLQFTAYNTIAYADIPREEMSDATAFYSTMQQMMLSLGICIAAMVLNGSVALFERTGPALSDFSLAFLVVTGISLLASPINALLPEDAGDDLAGRSKPAAGAAVHTGMR
jgi:EmrB/QacA subfamily drug resistance transporter